MDRGPIFILIFGRVGESDVLQTFHGTFPAGLQQVALLIFCLVPDSEAAFLVMDRGLEIFLTSSLEYPRNEIMTWGHTSGWQGGIQPASWRSNILSSKPLHNDSNFLCSVTCRAGFLAINIAADSHWLLLELLLLP